MENRVAGVRSRVAPVMGGLLAGVEAVRSCVIASVIVLMAGLALGQIASSVSGTVRDKSGAVVVEAAVKIVNPAKGITQAATTNSEGVFVFPSLPPGTYSITVEKQGFRPLEKSNIILSTGDRLSAGEFVL